MLSFGDQVKSNIGHGEAVAGMNGLLKAILTVENGMIPGNPTFLEPSPLSKIREDTQNIVTGITWLTISAQST